MKSKGINNRTAFDKRVRQKTHREGILYRSALNGTPGNEWIHPFKMKHQFKTRREGMQWNSKYFISGTEVDDGELFIPEEDVYDFKIDFMDTSDSTRRHHTDIAISLYDIARPARRKGIAEDFEVVQKSRNVIALEDNFEGLEYAGEDDEWEQIYDERWAEEPRSYSFVLRGNET